MFPRLEKENRGIIEGDRVQEIMNDPAFSDFSNINVLPLIYDEKSKRCNILVFDYARARSATTQIRYVGERKRKKEAPCLSILMMPKALIFARCDMVMLLQTHFNGVFGRTLKMVLNFLIALLTVGLTIRTITFWYNFSHMHLSRP